MGVFHDAIARLRRSQPRNTDTMLVCDELERMLQSHSVNPRAVPFNKVAYQREYMRKWRRKKA